VRALKVLGVYKGSPEAYSAILGGWGSMGGWVAWGWGSMGGLGSMGA